MLQTEVGKPTSGVCGDSGRNSGQVLSSGDNDKWPGFKCFRRWHSAGFIGIGPVLPHKALC